MENRTAEIQGFGTQGQFIATIRSAQTRDKAAADTLAAALPKAVRAQVIHCWVPETEACTKYSTVYWVEVHANCQPSGNKGQANETGIKRLIRAVRALRALGYEVKATQARCLNHLEPAWLSETFLCPASVQAQRDQVMDAVVDAILPEVA